MTTVDCTWYYFNRSAAMGWVFGMSTSVSFLLRDSSTSISLTDSICLVCVMAYTPSVLQDSSLEEVLLTIRIHAAPPHYLCLGSQSSTEAMDKC